MPRLLKEGCCQACSSLFDSPTELRRALTPRMIITLVRHTLTGLPSSPFPVEGGGLMAGALADALDLGSPLVEFSSVNLN